MKRYLTIATLALSGIAFADHEADHVDCALIPGFHGYGGAGIPECFLTPDGHATIRVNDRTRLDWNGFNLGTAGFRSLTIVGEGDAVVLYEQGSQLSVNGRLQSDSRLGIFAPNIFIGSAGSITAPELALIAMIPDSGVAGADTWLSGGSVEVGGGGTFYNAGGVETTGGLMIVGESIINTATGSIVSHDGAIELVAAGGANVQGVSANANDDLPQSLPAIVNGGRISGRTLSLRVVPYDDNDGEEQSADTISQVNLINHGLLEGREGVVVDLTHPTSILPSGLPYSGAFSHREGAVIIAPNPDLFTGLGQDFIDNGAVKGFALIDGKVVRPQEDEPIAPPSSVSSVGQSLPQTALPSGLSATYSALNSLAQTSKKKKSGATSKTAVNSRGTAGQIETKKRKKKEETAKKKAPAKKVIRSGSFFGVRIVPKG